MNTLIQATTTGLWGPWIPERDEDRKLAGLEGKTLTRDTEERNI